MPRRCPRCGRGHNGSCGIPPSVTLGFGARVGGVNGREPVATQKKPRQKPPEPIFLQSMLAQAREHLVKVRDMLKAIPPELSEYTELLDKESELSALIAQLVGQIAAREGVK